MSNPVTDGILNWQPDADTLDSNLPVNATIMSDGAAGDLDGELRRIKSEIRHESLLKSWERWLGMMNLAGTGNIAFTFVSATSFSVNDNLTGSGRVVALAGRTFVAYGPGGVYIGGGIITGVNWSSPNTTVSVFMIDNPLNATLVEIQFGVYPFASPAKTILSTYAFGISPTSVPVTWQFYNCPGAPANGFTLALKKWPIPRGGILRNLFVQHLPAAGSGAATVVVNLYINGVIPNPSFLCIVGPPTAQAHNLLECINVQAGDLLTFEFNNTSPTDLSGHLLASVELD